MFFSCNLPLKLVDQGPMEVANFKSKKINLNCQLLIPKEGSSSQQEGEVGDWTQRIGKNCAKAITIISNRQILTWSLQFFNICQFYQNLATG